MAVISVTVDTSGLAQIAKDIDDLTPLYQIWAAYMDSVTVTAFKTETSPQGDPWQSLSPKYAKRRQRIGKAKYGDKILRVTGRLYDSLAATVDPDGVSVGTNIMVGNYNLGAIHQYGAPRRPFLPLDSSGVLLPATAEKVKAIAEAWIAKQLK